MFSVVVVLRRGRVDFCKKKFSSYMVFNISDLRGRLILSLSNSNIFFGNSSRPRITYIFSNRGVVGEFCILYA